MAGNSKQLDQEKPMNTAIVSLRCFSLMATVSLASLLGCTSGKLGPSLISHSSGDAAVAPAAVVAAPVSTLPNTNTNTNQLPPQTPAPVQRMAAVPIATDTASVEGAAVQGEVAQVAWNQPTAGGQRLLGGRPTPAMAHPMAHAHAPAANGAPAAGSDCSCCNKTSCFQSGPWNQFGTDPQEFLCDGGDLSGNAHVRQDDALVGIDLEDTVVKYTTQKGEIHVQPSNRVCIYAPRFAAVRKVTEAVAGEQTVAALGYDVPEGPGRIDLNQPSSAVTAQHSLERQVVSRTVDAMRDLDRGMPIEGVDQPLLAEDTLAILQNLSLISQGMLTEADKPWLSKGALAAETWTIEENVAVTVADVSPVEQIRHAAAEGLTLYEFPDAGRLRIVKLADKQDALPGEIVTFLLRVDNVGDSPVRDVVLTDNLTNRLEYVADSQTCSSGAEFETEVNIGGSLRLTWKLTDTLKVGESSSIRFRCKVR
ncbi:hypothetical protein FF011L_37180 [Roseimaritima multifibrata]|uniref:DUF11 domain-containing protein n=1 Tax=Roseimaritima multifibrata TaxID=1930274 RepID=A0A517MJB0_9BACT|nr:DUF11 domain-containing protein [Roseimaritima multifibrata]QDS94934.1 hypothetical protein FF011L_37180 [Roseimaritima multifibrata]